MCVCVNVCVFCLSVCVCVCVHESVLCAMLLCAFSCGVFVDVCECVYMCV